MQPLHDTPSELSLNITSYRYAFDRARHAWWRRRSRTTVETLYGEMVECMDKGAFIEALGPYWDPFAAAGVAKYLSLDTWLREAIYRYLLSTEGLNTSGRIVDLGSGTGYFLWVCSERGHEVLGIDVEGESVYDICIDLLEIPRVNFRIEAMKPLCETGADLKLITAFMTCFDRYEDGRPWDVDAWAFFLADVRKRLKKGGRLVIKFNAEPQTGELYSSDVQRLFRRTPDFRCRLFLDYLMLTAR